MIEIPEIVYEQIGTDKNGVPYYGPAGSTPDKPTKTGYSFWQVFLLVSTLVVSGYLAHP
jgi:hypothetical protein